MTPMHYVGLPESVRSAYLLGLKPSSEDKIMKSVCKNTGVSLDLLKSRSRKSYIVGPRQIAIYLLRKTTSKTLVEIGTIFGMDHSTIIYSIRKSEDLLQTDKAFKVMYEIIVQGL